MSADRPRASGTRRATSPDNSPPLGSVAQTDARGGVQGRPPLRWPPFVIWKSTRAEMSTAHGDIFAVLTEVSAPRAALSTLSRRLLPDFGSAAPSAAPPNPRPPSAAEGCPARLLHRHRRHRRADLADRAAFLTHRPVRRSAAASFHKHRRAVLLRLAFPRCARPPRRGGQRRPRGARLTTCGLSHSQRISASSRRFRTGASRSRRR